MVSPWLSFLSFLDPKFAGDYVIIASLGPDPNPWSFQISEVVGISKQQAAW